MVTTDHIARRYLAKIRIYTDPSGYLAAVQTRQEAGIALLLRALDSENYWSKILLASSLTAMSSRTFSELEIETEIVVMPTALASAN